MKTIFETCDARQEGLKGELKDEIFRASLTEVNLNNPEDVYQNPDVFFELTYRTDGLKALLKESLA